MAYYSQVTTLSRYINDRYLYVPLNWKYRTSDKNMNIPIGPAAHHVRIERYEILGVSV